MSELEQGLAEISQLRRESSTLDLIVRRPAVNEREVLDEGELDTAIGLVGDRWHSRGGSRTTADASATDTQLTIMDSRVIQLLAQSRDRWALAGDQLYVDLDLSVENLPTGTQLALGSAVIEVTAQPHTGCDKFVSRFGLDAMKFVNSPAGRKHRLRGLYARVIRPGAIRVGDTVRKLATSAAS